MDKIMQETPEVKIESKPTQRFFRFAFAAPRGSGKNINPALVKRCLNKLYLSFENPPEDFDVSFISSSFPFLTSSEVSYLILNWDAFRDYMTAKV